MTARVPLAIERFRRHVSKYVRFTDREFEVVVSQLRLRHVGKGEPVLVPGDVCVFEGFVASGCVRVYFNESDGSERVLYFAPEGWWVTDIASLLSATPSALGIDAVETSELLIIDKGARDLLRHEVPAFERLLAILAEETLVASQQRIIACMRKTAEQRYEDFVCRYPGLEGRIPQYQVAAYIGVSAEFLSRIRKRL